MKKQVNNSSNKDINSGEMPKQKERHIVSWSQEEDDILREQIRVHGTDNWAIIASKFKDKTTRQCRRRWFTYLNSDFKKGGWSPEEDMLLCEAQKIFGNRWTEIAKVVSGRTDNAVKNRFTTLCKKRAKREALTKENSATSYVNLNNKRVLFRNKLNAGKGSESSAAALKKMRIFISEHCDQGKKLAGECGVADNLPRSPFAVIAQNVSELHVENIKEASTEGSAGDKNQGLFLRKDDPKVLALMQQAELLSSLATIVNTDKTDQSLENAHMVLQNFLKQNKQIDMLASRNSDIDFQLEKFKELVEDLRSCDEGSGPSFRENNIYDSSPACSEYSTEECEAEISVVHKGAGLELQSDQLDNQDCLAEDKGICLIASTKDEVQNTLTCDEIKNSGAVCEYPNTGFSSPLHVTPLFQAWAAAVPSPKFSESEKHFLMKTLGMDSTSQSAKPNPSQPAPLCKRSLLRCL